MASIRSFSELGKELATAEGPLGAAARTASETLGEAARNAAREGSELLKKFVHPDEIEETRNALGIGQMFHGSTAVETKPLARRTADGIMLEAPEGHTFQIEVAGRYGSVHRALRTADGGIFENVDRGIASEQGSNKLHMGTAPDGQRFVKSLQMKEGDVPFGILSPNSPSELWYKYTWSPLRESQVREVYAQPTTNVRIAGDTVRSNVVEMRHLYDDDLIHVTMHPPGGSITTEWSILRGTRHSTICHSTQKPNNNRTIGIHFEWNELTAQARSALRVVPRLRDLTRGRTFTNQAEN